MTVLQGGRRLATKINITFFVGNEVFNIFHKTIFFIKQFFRKNNIFQNNCEKNFWGDLTIFEGTGRRMRKINITFSVGNVVPILFLSFFLKEPHTGWMKSKKPILGAHFPPYLWFYWAAVFKNNRTDLHQPCEFHENRFKTGSRTRRINIADL